MSKIAEMKQLSIALKSKQPLISINTADEERLLNNLTELARTQNRQLFVWKRTKGLGEYTTNLAEIKWQADTADIEATLESLNNEVIKVETQQAIYVFLDINDFLQEPYIIRQFKDLYTKWSIGFRNAIFVSPFVKIPEELQKMTFKIEYELPTLEDIIDLLDNLYQIFEASKYPSSFYERYKESKRGMAVSLQGLTEFEITKAVLYSVVKNSKFNDSIINDLLEQKRQIIKKSGLLEFQDTTNIPDVGGLTNLMDWLKRRGKAFSEEARAFGLSYPKGVFLLGVPGTGKSLVAKNIAKYWNMPCISWDISKMFGSLQGETESNVEMAIKTIESIQPCICYIDEVDKLLSGTGSSNQTDGGTGDRVMGKILSWLQNKTSAVFVVATANRIHTLPPEFLRKGRFDELFFVGLPDESERADISRIHSKKMGIILTDAEIERVVAETKNYSGAEIEAAFMESKYIAFEREGAKKVTVEDVIVAIRETKILFDVQKEIIRNMVKWAEERARFANAYSEETVKNYELINGTPLTKSVQGKLELELDTKGLPDIDIDIDI